MRERSADRPLRTCVGCRAVRQQATLLRLARTPDGRVEPDPERRGGGRGVYLCRREACLAESMRRGRWPHAFRAPASVTAETLVRLSCLVAEGREPVEGGW